MVKFKSLSPRTTMIFVTLMDSVATAMLLLLLNAHATELGFSEIQIGWPESTFTGCQILTAPFLGSLSDIRGRKSIMMSCFIFCSFSYFWLGLTSSVFMFIALRSVLGMINHTPFLITALAPDYITEPMELSSFYGRLMTISSIATGLATSFSETIMDKFQENGFTAACIVIATFYMITTVLIKMLPEVDDTSEVKITKDEDESREKKSNENFKETKQSISFEKSLKQAVYDIFTVEWSKYWDIFLFILLLTLVKSSYYNNFEIFLKINHDISLKILGNIMTMQRIIGDISNNFINPINKKYADDTDSTERIMHTFVLIALCLFALSLVPTVFLYMLFIVPSTMMFSIARLVTLEALLTRSNSENRGLLLGISSSVKTVATVIAPIMTGVISQYLGVSYIYYAGAVIALAGAYTAYRIRIRSAKEKAE